jgi:hypothetical protein
MSLTDFGGKRAFDNFGKKNVLFRDIRKKIVFYRFFGRKAVFDKIQEKSCSFACLACLVLLRLTFLS